MAFPLTICVTLGTLHFTTANLHTLLCKKRSLAHEIWLPTVTSWHFWSESSTTNNRSLLFRNWGHIALMAEAVSAHSFDQPCVARRWKWHLLKVRLKIVWQKGGRNRNSLTPILSSSVYCIGLYKAFPCTLSIWISQTMPWESRLAIVNYVCERDLSSNFAQDERTRTKTRCSMLNKLKIFQVYSPRFISAVSLLVDWDMTINQFSALNRILSWPIKEE